MNRYAGLLASTLVLLAGAARAENPRLSLKLENVTAEEAAAALTKAVGVPVEVHPGSDPRLGKRLSLDWTNITLANALRQIRDRYELTLVRSGNSYAFTAAQGRAPVERPRLGQTDAGSARLFVTSVSVAHNRRLPVDAAQAGSSGGAQVGLGLELPDGDAETVVGVLNATARDDQGTVLMQEQVFRGIDLAGQLAFRGGFIGVNGLPDEWSGTLNFPSPNPRARKLTWLEGEVWGYRHMQVHRLEFPATGLEKGARQEKNGLTAEVTSYVEKALGQPGGSENRSVSVEVELTLPAGKGISLRRQFGNVVLVGASGKRWNNGSGGSNGSTQNGVQQVSLRQQFGRITEPIRAVVLELVEHGPEERLFTFRMTDIPLPAEEFYLPRSFSRPAPLNGLADPGFKQADGGVLAVRAQIGGTPVSGGRLSLGLSAIGADGATPIQWIDVDVARDGTAKSPALRPGRYRLLQVYRPDENVRLDAAGHWENSELFVDVTAGNETAVPALAWAVK